ncbi:MAG: flagellar biosynthesis anti-sigma factor FlgM [Sedimentibacter sp.]|uniref:flagellar biosynthesis anti-sigma factor FlgM n=1 Tax=Sedimentibacter sp. TaxID=1960295 RepID=UPI002982839C|nr:flagellar biosynthesis anti-sigma factor FlgM [Sedimentibacter sp.]MDW5300104.1 flagellar biosynthesis anti-sigma factor FlgM [Sedimentibacter sp.]
MKIQNINNHMSYKGGTKPVKIEESVKSKKYDVVDIKNKTLSTHEKHDTKLDDIKKDVVMQINAETDVNKINKIKESVRSNTYNIDVDEIISKLLK